MRIKMKMMFALIPFSFILFSFCQKNSVSIQETSEFPNASAQNMDEGLLSQAYQQAEQFESLRALIVARNGVTVAERYFVSRGRTELHDVRSVTKSVTSILIGIAIDQGLIKDVHQTFEDLFKDEIIDFGFYNQLDSVKKTITIHHLLTMSAGFEWVEFGDWSEYSTWRNVPNQVDYILAKPIVTTPGEVFCYNDAAAHLLSVILQGASGMTALEFAQTYLFDPLNINSAEWTTDNQGYNFGSVALKITPRDMLKLGRLFQQQGMFNESQVVSSEWVEASTRPHISTGLGSDYGYLWWVNQVGSHDFYMANGYGGQLIINVPDLNLTVVATNNWSGYSGAAADQNWSRTFNLIMNYIIPAAN